MRIRTSRLKVANNGLKTSWRAAQLAHSEQSSSGGASGADVGDAKKPLPASAEPHLAHRKHSACQSRPSYVTYLLHPAAKTHTQQHLSATSTGSTPINQSHYVVEEPDCLLVRSAMINRRRAVNHAEHMQNKRDG